MYLLYSWKDKSTRWSVRTWEINLFSKELEKGYGFPTVMTSLALPMLCFDCRVPRHVLVPSPSLSHPLSTQMFFIDTAGLSPTLPSTPTGCLLPVQLMTFSWLQPTSVLVTNSAQGDKGLPRSKQQQKVGRSCKNPDGWPAIPHERVMFLSLSLPPPTPIIKQEKYHYFENVGGLVVVKGLLIGQCCRETWSNIPHDPRELIWWLQFKGMGSFCGCCYCFKKQNKTVMNSILYIKLND